MSSRVASRPRETAALSEFLAAIPPEACALVLEGEPGIGKSTVLLAALDEARRLGFRVLMARPAQTESVLAYAALTDLLGGVDDATWDQLPPAQRHAIDRVMLWDDTAGPATDQRAVAAGFLTMVEILADQGPLLLAVDDLQWLDPSSAHVISFVSRRLPSGVRMLGTVRTGTESGASADWLQLPTPDAVRRIAIQPLSLGGLHAVVAERIGRSFPRPAMARIRDVSGGNPFYAIELARAMTGAGGQDVPLPATLTDLVRERVGDLGAELHQCLLATACLARPTVDIVARATGSEPTTVVDLLQEAESKGLVEIDGVRMRFTHPLLARGVYTDASPSRRRAMHRTLADLVDQPELRARHLALSATTVDQRTLEALDEAADTARTRGAPAAAAEFTDLAISLGGDTPQRRIRSAGMYFNSGDTVRARATLERTIKELDPGELRAEALNLLGVVMLFGDSFVEAAELLDSALEDAGDNLPLRVPILITAAFALVNSGRMDEALDRARTAIADATRLEHDHLLSEALGMHAVLAFMRGDGHDETVLRRIVELEDRDRSTDTPVAFRPHALVALLRAWTGRLDDGRAQLTDIRAECLEHGEESDLIFVAFHQVMVEIWTGRLAEATLLVEDFTERALQLGTDLPMSVALTTRALLGAYQGRVDQTRVDAEQALAALRRCGSTRLGEWPVTAMGFLEVSLGDHRAALTTLAPLLAFLDTAPAATELITATCAVDAIEAMIALDRLDDAECLIERFERNGNRLDRPWMLAVGARSRAMLLAARGDVDAAAEKAQQAMVEHDRLPMPFERARTQLLLGQLHRRQRHKDAAAATLKEALDAFERLGTPLWAERARAELGRANVGPRRTGGLTPSEQRVAELAASGMTNREVASALFISPKTVEANLARIYRKLGIRSRAELGRVTPHD